MSERPTCSWDGERWTNPAGTACNEDHCAMRGRCPSHVRHAAGLFTCGGCVGKVRRNLKAIGRLWIALGFDALNDGIDSEAMNLVGPAASVEQIHGRRALEERRGWCNFPRTIPREDERHPYAVLGRIDMALRETYGPRTDLLITVPSTIDYLDSLLNRPEFVNGDEFEDTAKGIADLRHNLEEVDADSRTPDLGRPCPTCAAERGKGPKLQKRYAHHPGMRPGQRCSMKTCSTCEGRNDAWHCPDFPEHAWTDADYRGKVDADYVEHADWLPDRDAEARTGVRAGTIREWARKIDDGLRYREPLIRKRREKGRVVYCIEDVQRVAAEKGMMSA